MDPAPGGRQVLPAAPQGGQALPVAPQGELPSRDPPGTPARWNPALAPATGRIATYNIGAGQPNSYRSEARYLQFRAKLEGDLRRLIDVGVGVILLQEVSVDPTGGGWFEEICGFMPRGWNGCPGPRSNTAVLYSAERYVEEGLLETHRANPYRGWRRLLQALL